MQLGLPLEYLATGLPRAKDDLYYNLFDSSAQPLPVQMHPFMLVHDGPEL
jgi:hypothetical protein